MYNFRNHGDEQTYTHIHTYKRSKKKIVFSQILINCTDN